MYEGLGYVDANRMTLLIRATGETPTERKVAEIIAMAHETGGKVSFMQFVEIIKGIRKSEARPSLSDIEAAFHVFDPSELGYIHRDELKRVLTTFGEKLSGEEVEGLIAVADIDEQGRIDYIKFAKQLLA